MHPKLEGADLQPIPGLRDKLAGVVWVASELRAGCKDDASHVHQSHNGASSHIRKIEVCACAENAGNISPATVSDLHVYHGTCVMHVPWCMPGSLTSGFLWIRWRGKRSRHSWRMHNPQFYVSGKRPMKVEFHCWAICHVVLYATVF